MDGLKDLALFQNLWSLTIFKRLC